MTTQSEPTTLFRPFGAEELKRILAPGSRPCASIYLPTHRRHPDWKQDPVRFRALTGQVESLLRGRPGIPDVEAFLDPLKRLEESPHWEHSLDGLAVLRSPDRVVAYRLPYPVPELALVSDSFHTKPLLGFLHANRRYLVLSVSQNHVALYEGSPYGAGEVDLLSVPHGLKEALGVPDLDRAFSQRSSGHAVLAFHGRGPGGERKKEDLLRYFRAIDRGLREYLRDERVPLLLAAVGYYHPIYREANTYPGLLERGLEGSFERTNPDEIHAAAWPIVREAHTKGVAGWVARYRELAGTGLASDRIDEVAAATIAGRTRALLVTEGESVWGTLDRGSGAVTRSEKSGTQGDADLLDDIGEEALQRGAEVLVIPRAAMPTQSPIAAVYRY